MYKVDNAIILAAGLSSRFTPFCMEKPKPLWSISGEVLIERLIRQLKAKNINEIYIVVGYEADKFSYLSSMFDGVKLVMNHDYASTNNLMSLEKVFSVLKNSIVVSSDLLFKTNLFENTYEDSIYTSVYMSPISGERLLRHKEETKKLFWADVQDKYLEKLKMKAKKIDANEIFEFDCFEDLVKYGIEHIDLDKSGRVCQMLDSLNIQLKDIVNCSKLDLSDRSFVLSTAFKSYKIKL